MLFWHYNTGQNHEKLPLENDPHMVGLTSLLRHRDRPMSPLLQKVSEQKSILFKTNACAINRDNGSPERSEICM